MFLVTWNQILLEFYTRQKVKLLAEIKFCNVQTFIFNIDCKNIPSNGTKTKPCALFYNCNLSEITFFKGFKDPTSLMSFIKPFTSALKTWQLWREHENFWMECLFPRCRQTKQRKHYKLGCTTRNRNRGLSRSTSNVIMCVVVQRSLN